MFEDFPLIRFRPAPTDQELEAERDRKHAADCNEFFNPSCGCGHPRTAHTPHCEGFWGCDCRRYRRHRDG